MYLLYSSEIAVAAEYAHFEAAAHLRVPRSACPERGQRHFAVFSPSFTRGTS